MRYFVILGIALWVYMTAWYVVSLFKKRNDVADIAWGIGFVLLAWLSWFLNIDSDSRGLLLAILITVWGVRLAVHIFRRNRGKAEDYRYQIWRQEWGKWFYLRSYGQVYVLQGLLLFLIILPVLLVNNSRDGFLGYLDVLGVLVWLVGFFFESVGDKQLSDFIRNPDNKGKLMQSGLWKYTRHPNYFGEVTQWWGVWLIAIGAPIPWFGIIGPLTITYLILKVSGIPMLEKKMQENPSFVEYARRTNKFFPWFPKK